MRFAKSPSLPRPDDMAVIRTIKEQPDYDFLYDARQMAERLADRGLVVRRGKTDKFAVTEAGEVAYLEWLKQFS